MKRNWKCALTVLLAIQCLACAASAAAFGEFNAVSINGAKGNSRHADGVFHLSNTTTNDGMVFVCQLFSGNGAISARIQRTAQTPRVGLLFRADTNAASAGAGMFLAGNNTIFERQIAANQPAIVTTRTNETWAWLRVVREGDALGGFYSADGTNWTQISADTVALPENIQAGFAISGVGEAEVKEVRMTSARLVSPSAKDNFVAPTNVVIKAETENLGGKIQRVEYFSNAAKIGETTDFPSALKWNHPLAGSYSLVAKITQNTGAEFFTEPVNCEIKLPPAQAKFIGVDDATRGDWQKKYGAGGYCIVRHATNFPAYAEVSATGCKSVFLTFSDQPAALKLTNGTGRIIAQWFTYDSMSVTISLLDGQTHQLAFYLHDSDSDLRMQQIEVIDAATQKVIDTRSASKFHVGKYYIWEIRGTVRFQMTPVAGNAVINGVFLDSRSDSISKTE